MLDEPLTNLDARLRVALRLAFKALHQETRQTILYVTHDQMEAMSLSDRLVVLDAGRIQQVGAPADVYARPATRFVAGFIGSPPMNLAEAELHGEAAGAWLDLHGVALAVAGPVPASALALRSRRVGFGIRPEAIVVAPAATTDARHSATVTHIERLGSRTVLDLRLDGRTALKAVVPAGAPYAEGAIAWLGLRVRPEHLIDPATGRFLA
jgi:multiple sugar transport system ATP-binding protein